MPRACARRRVATFELGVDRLKIVPVLRLSFVEVSGGAAHTMIISGRRSTRTDGLRSVLSRRGYGP